MTATSFAAADVESAISVCFPATTQLVRCHAAVPAEVISGHDMPQLLGTVPEAEALEAPSLQ